MIRRGDLTKQFELVVQQEIINHNKTILATNVAINELKSSVQDIDKATKKNKYFYEDGLENLSDYMTDVYEKLDDKIRDLNSNFNDFSNTVIKKLSHIKPEEIVLQEDLDFAFKFSEEIDELHSVCENTSKEFKKHKNEINKTITDFYCDFTKSLTEFQKENAKNPKETEILRKEITDKLAISKVDIIGNREEMENLKKKQFILEKTCEHLLTQINRLKEAK